MKRLLAVALAFCFAGCGNWSNEDVEFLYALPSHQDLQVKLPAESGTTGQGLAQRKDGLSLDAPSDAYARTKKTAEDFNAGLFRLLELLQKVRSLPPSEREANRRVWGPYNDENRRQNRLVVTRVIDEAEGTHYAWQIESRRIGNETWIEIISGSFSPTKDVRRGAGVVTLEAERVRLAGMAGPDDDGNLRRLEIRYVTDADPVRVELDFVLPLGTLELLYEKNGDGSGRMRFDATADWYPAGSGGTAAQETLTVHSAWVPSGAGRADFTVTGGDVGASKLDGGEECWDSAFNVVYGREVWDSDGDGTVESVGDPTACAL